MRADIKVVIEKFYPESGYTNPLKRKDLLSPDHGKLIYDIIGEIKHRLGRNLSHASDGQYDLSERIAIKDHVILRISFLGPFAHMNFKLAARHLKEAEIAWIKKEVKEILDHFEVLLLSDEEILEEIPWLDKGDFLVSGKVHVWNCLFCEA